MPFVVPCLCRVGTRRRVGHLRRGTRTDRPDDRRDSAGTAKRQSSARPVKAGTTRRADGTDGQLIPARTIVPDNHVGPGKTVHHAFAFSVAKSAKVFTLVVRADLESAKRAGDAVEIDLNCC